MFLFCKPNPFFIIIQKIGMLFIQINQFD